MTRPRLWKIQHILSCTIARLPLSLGDARKIIMSLGHLLIARVILPGHGMAWPSNWRIWRCCKYLQIPKTPKNLGSSPFPIVSRHGQWIWSTWRCCPSLEKKKQHVEQVGYGSRPPAAWHGLIMFDLISHSSWAALVTEVMIETPQAARVAMQVAVAKDEREGQLEPGETSGDSPLSAAMPISCGLWRETENAVLSTIFFVASLLAQMVSWGNVRIHLHLPTLQRIFED